jgi:hypothetical protein
MVSWKYPAVYDTSFTGKREQTTNSRQNKRIKIYVNHERKMVLVLYFFPASFFTSAGREREHSGKIKVIKAGVRVCSCESGQVFRVPIGDIKTR